MPRPFFRTAGAPLLFALLLPLHPGHAQTIVDEWKSIPQPTAPSVAPVTVDAANSALLILDMYARTCNDSERPRCVRTIPKVQHLLAQARASHMKVIYSGSPPGSNASNDPVAVLAPQAGEPMVRAVADKFIGSDLESLLAADKIKTVIVVGTSADGTVLYTASHAAFNGLKVVVPVDGISSHQAYSELYTLWHLKNTVSQVSGKVTLTQTDLVTIR